MYTYFLSDIHVGINDPENWYQSYVHERLVKKALSYIQSKGKAVDDVVILGDWFDDWMYGKDNRNIVNLPVGEIIKKNSGLFTPSSDGDFVTCLNSIGGNFYYINGNHDMTVNCDDVNRALNLSGKKIIGGTYYHDKNNNIYAEHGNQFSLSCNVDNNAANKFAPLPIGYYVSRTTATFCLGEIAAAGVKSSAELPDSGNPGKNELSSIEQYLEKNKCSGMTFAQAYLGAVVYTLSKHSTLDDYVYLMPDGKTITAAQAAEYFSWIPWTSLSTKNFLYVDLLNDLTEFGQNLIKQKNCRLSVLGHTHVPIISPETSLSGVAYANTGYLCADIPGMKNQTKFMTFCEVENSPTSIKVRIMKIDYNTGNVTPLGSHYMTTISLK